ncbi:MAG: DUF4743 domain-containing protein [Alphaproteobacteria bacterium]|nr:DUF4743 domain-containing protein [Alphaproteobacteria bacterium SS10]
MTTELASGFQRHIDRLNDFSAADRQPLRIGGEAIGWLGPQTAAALLSAGLIVEGEGYALPNQQDGDPEARTVALAAIAEHLVGEGLMGDLRGEIYKVCQAWDALSLASIDRRAIPHLGLPSYGVHVNGVVRTERGIEMWIATRALDREVEPGKLDNMIAGGQPGDLSLMENLIKEAEEEAGVAANLANQAQQVATLTYRHGEGAERVKNDTIFAYDLWLPEDFVPVNTDGEVHSFERLPVEEVAQLVHDTDRFKPNCNLVIIDFVRRLTPELATQS